MVRGGFILTRFIVCLGVFIILHACLSVHPNASVVEVVVVEVVVVVVGLVDGLKKVTVVFVVSASITFGSFIKAIININLTKIIFMISLTFKFVMIMLLLLLLHKLAFFLLLHTFC